MTPECVQHYTNQINPVRQNYKIAGIKMHHPRFIKTDVCNISGLQSQADIQCVVVKHPACLYMQLFPLKLYKACGFAFPVLYHHTNLFIRSSMTDGKGFLTLVRKTLSACHVCLFACMVIEVFALRLVLEIDRS